MKPRQQRMLALGLVAVGLAIAATSGIFVANAEGRSWMFANHVGRVQSLSLGAEGAPQPFTLAIDDLSLTGALQLSAEGTALSAEGRFAEGGATFPVPKALRGMPLPLRCPFWGDAWH